MIVANFETNDSVKYVKGLHQYDKGQVLQITGLNLPRVVEIDFSLEETGAVSKSCPALTKDGITEVEIPNEMLINSDADMDYNIYAFVYVTDGEAGETVKRIVMQVRARTKPEQFEAMGNRELFEQAIAEVNQSAKTAERFAVGRADVPESLKDNAKYYAGESAKSVESIRGVEQNVKDMVATIGGIEQQVQDVKKYAGQAQSASKKASLSEQNAKKSEEASLQYQTGAETAQSNAQLSEQNAKKSEEAIEQSKAYVEQVKQAVGNDKTHIDGQIADFNGKVTEANVSIDAKKTESLSAIGTAKTEAVGAIGTAKADAVGVVATAKDDAVSAVVARGTEQAKKVTDEGTKQVEAVNTEAQKHLKTMQDAVNGIVADRQQISQNKADVTALKEDLKGFVPKQQGAENKGKALVVGDDGNVTVGEVQGGDGIPIINTMSGASPLVIPDSAERANKGLSIIGNTMQNQDPPPSPDNPQAIKNVGRWNGVTRKYEVDIKVTNGKESWDKEQTITITSDRPITKWDKVVEQDGQIGWLYASKKYVITGNEVFEYRSGYDQDAYTNRFITINDLFINRLNDKQLVYCKILKRVQYIYAQNKLEEGLDTNINQLHIKLSNDRIGVLSSDNTQTRTTKIAEYIKNTYTDGIEIMYMSNDSVFVPLTQSEQDAIRALKTYYPTTVITVDGGEVVPTVELTYTADTKNFILNREKAMQAQMLNIQDALISQKISGGGIKVTDSAGLPVEEFAMSGRAEQVQTTGKNLFDEEKLLNLDDPNYDKNQAFKGLFYYKFKTDEPVTVSVTKLNKDGEYLCVGAEPNGSDATWLSHKTVPLKNFKTVTPKDGYIYLGVNTTLKAIKNMIRKTGGIMINHGLAVMPYEPYTGGKPSPSPEYPQPIEVTLQGVITVDFTDGLNHQIVELNCPREFTKWDRLQKIGGVWNWVFKTVKDTDVKQSRFDLFGWNHASQYKDFENGVYAYVWSFKNKEKGWQTSICKQFKNENGSYNTGKLWHYSDSPEMDRQYFVTNHKTAEEFEAWMEANPLTMYFEGKETEYVPLLQEEQDKLNTLTMYAPNTDVTNTGGCNMELTYTVDTKSYVDAKILTLSKALL